VTFELDAVSFIASVGQRAVLSTGLPPHRRTFGAGRAEPGTWLLASDAGQRARRRHPRRQRNAAALIYDLVGGKIRRIRIFLDRDQALEAAGLRE
jgi:hypothetical protein